MGSTENELHICMQSLNDLPCTTLVIKAIQWCNKNNLITTEDKINRVIEGTTQGDVFLKVPINKM